MFFKDFLSRIMWSWKRGYHAKWGIVFRAWVETADLNPRIMDANEYFWGDFLENEWFFPAYFFCRFCCRDVACNVSTWDLETQIIPCIWFGITTNSSKTTNGKCGGISIQNFCANYPISFNSIFAVTPNLGVSTIFPKKCWRSLVHMVTKQEPLLV